MRIHVRYFSPFQYIWNIPLAKTHTKYPSNKNLLPKFNSFYQIAFTWQAQIASLGHLVHNSRDALFFLKSFGITILFFLVKDNLTVLQKRIRIFQKKSNSYWVLLNIVVKSKNEKIGCSLFLSLVKRQVPFFFFLCTKF